MAKELKWCSGCKCTMVLEEYFSKNRKDEWWKTCDGCRAKFECEQCGKEYSSKSDLTRHIRAVHLKLKPYGCNQCDYKCSYKGHLNQHIKSVHSKIKDFECNQCDAKFPSNGKLQRHIGAVHMELKPYGCNQCDAKFSGGSHLQRHIKTVHMELKPYECNQCDAKFSANSDVQRHIGQVHNNEKHFECPECNHKFYSKSGLNAHTPKCTGEEKCSAGEYQVMKSLGKLGLVKDIDYYYGQSYVVKDKRLLLWDFRIPVGDTMVFIEYDGRCHIQPIKWSGKWTDEEAQFNLDEYKRKDKIKDDFCYDNNYQLLRIPHTDFDNIDFLVSAFMSEFV